MKEHPYKITFASKIQTISDNGEKEKFVSIASKNSNIAKLIPKDIDLTQNDGFVLITGEAFIGNLINANQDGVKATEAIELAKGVPFTYLDINHSRNKLCGVAIASKFTDYKTGKELTENDVKNSKEPFSVTITGIVWTAPNPELAKAIENMNASDSPLKDSVYFSWELSFSTQELVLLKPKENNIFAGKIISNEDEIEKLLPKLISNGGNGLTDDGLKIGRVPVGEVTVLGFGLVENPAAAVSPIQVPNKDESAASILTEEQSNKLKSLPESGMGYQICDIEMNDGGVYHSISVHNCSVLSKPLNINEIKEFKLSYDKDIIASEHKTVKCSCGNIISNCRCSHPNKKVEIVESGCKDCKDKLTKDAIQYTAESNIQNNISQVKNPDVIKDNINNSFMTKIDSIEKITDESLVKSEIKASDIKELFASANKVIVDEALDKIGKDYNKKITEKDGLIKDAVANSEKLQISVNDLDKQLKELTTNYNKIVTQNQEREKLESFSARMSSIENDFDLDDKQKEIVANKVKTIASDEDFTKYLDEINVLLAAKKKVAKPAKKDGKDDNDEEDEEKAKAKKSQAKASLEDDSAKSVADALKNGKEDEKNIIANAGAKEETLAEKSKRVFGMDGWSIVDKRKNRL